LLQPDAQTIDGNAVAKPEHRRLEQPRVLPAILNRQRLDARRM
jgi:hypothetical protein